MVTSKTFFFFLILVLNNVLSFSSSAMVIDIGQIVHTLPRLTVNVYDIMLLTKQQPEWREEKTKKKKKNPI